MNTEIKFVNSHAPKQVPIGSLLKGNYFVGTIGLCIHQGFGEFGLAEKTELITGNSFLVEQSVMVIPVKKVTITYET